MIIGDISIYQEIENCEGYELIVNKWRGKRGFVLEKGVYKRQNFPSYSFLSLPEV
jgi:hypothetical protein